MVRRDLTGCSNDMSTLGSSIQSDLYQTSTLLMSSYLNRDPKRIACSFIALRKSLKEKQNMMSRCPESAHQHHWLTSERHNLGRLGLESASAPLPLYPTRDVTSNGPCKPRAFRFQCSRFHGWRRRTKDEGPPGVDVNDKHRQIQL